MLYVLICVVCLWAMTVNVAVGFTRPDNQFSFWHWVILGVAMMIFLLTVDSIPSTLDELFSLIIFGFLIVLCWVSVKGAINQPKS